MEIIYWVGFVLFWITAMSLEVASESKADNGYDFNDFIVSSTIMLAVSMFWPAILIILFFVGCLYCMFKLLTLIFKRK